MLGARGIPSCGYTTFTLKEGPAPATESEISVSERVLENRFFRVELDDQGRLSSLLDKVTGRQVLPPGSKANLLQLFEDKPLDFDAWEIDIYYQDRMWEIEGIESIRVLEEGPVRGGIEVTRSVGRSRVTQRLDIYDEVPRFNFETYVDWQQKHRLP